MNITFYSGTPDKRKATKTLTTLNTVLCAPYTGFSIEKPILRISNYPPVNATMFYIDDLQRYYVITDIEYTSGGICLISGEIDLLYTYWDVIKNQEFLISRNEFIQDTTLVDNLIPLKRDKQTEVHNVGIELQKHGNCYVLGVIE